MPEPTVSSQDLVEEPRCLQHPAQVQLASDLKSDLIPLKTCFLRSAPTSPPSNSSTSLSSSPRGGHQSQRPLGQAKKFLSSDGEQACPLSSHTIPSLVLRFWPKVFKLLRRRTEALLVLRASSTSSGVLVLLFDVFQGVKVQPALLQRSSKKLNSAWQLPHTREQRRGKRYGTNKKRRPFQNLIKETANDEAVPGSGSARVRTRGNSSRVSCTG